MDFAVPVEYSKIERKRKEGQVPGPCKGIEKTVGHESDDYNNFNWCSWYSQQKIGTRTGRLGNNGTRGECPNYSIIEIGQNTEKSLGDMRKFVVTQTPVNANAGVKTLKLVQ